MENFPVTDTLGYPEMLWTVRDLVRRVLSKTWTRQNGTIEGYEFHAAKNNGWLVVYYSYDYEGHWFGGGFRTWLLINTSDRDAITTKLKHSSLTVPASQFA